MWKKIDNDTEIFETPDRIEAAKKDLASDSREQLLKRIHVFQGSDDHRKAAILLLAEMDKKDSDKKHRIIVIIGIFTLLFAFLAFLLDLIHLPKEKPNTASQELKIEQQDSKPKIQNPSIQKEQVSTIQPQTKKKDIKAK